MSDRGPAMATVTLTGPLDPRDGCTATNCPIDRTIGVVGNRSAFLLLREAFYGATRFDDFAERVGVSESVAAARLKSLVEEVAVEDETRAESPADAG